MKKKLLLVVVALAAGAALWTLLDQEGEDSEGVTGAPGSSAVAPAETGAPELANVGERSQAAPGTSRWTVKPLDAKTGEVLDDALVSATKVLATDLPSGADAPGAGKTLEGKGSATFEEVPAGEWTLLVRAKGYPDRVSRVRVKVGEDVQTTVEMDSTLRVKGRVVNAYGEPMGYREVLFLRPGQKRPEAGPEVRKLPVTRADPLGRFELDLPAAGEWRAHVTYGGETSFVQAASSTLTHGGPVEAVITVPAAARLLVRVEDPTVDPQRRVYAVSLYRDGSLLDKKPVVRGPEATQQPDPSEISEEQQKEIDIDAEKEANVFGDPNDPETARRKAAHELAQQLRASVRPEGWVMAKSLRLREDGTAEVPGVPSGEEFRAAIGRSGEAIRVDGSIFVIDAQTTLARIVLPPALPPGSPPLTEVRTAELSLETVEQTRKPVASGVVWN